MRIVYMILVAISLFLALLCLQYLDQGFRELMIVSWIGIALYSLYLFARPEQETKKSSSYDRQKAYEKRITRKVRSPYDR